MIIDFRLRPPHRHYLRLLLHDPKKIKSYCDRMGIDPAPSAMERSMALLEAEMRDAGVTIGVMNARSTPGVAGIVTNDEIAEIAAEYPGKFLGFGTLPLLDANTVDWSPEAIRKETRRCIAELGLRGMSIDPYYWRPPLYVDSPLLDPLYEACIELDVPVLMTLSCSSPPDFSYCAPARVDALATKHPTLKIVVGHGCWPYVQEMCGVVFRHRNVWIAPDMYMLAPGAEAYVQAANTFARDRFLFGTCYPSLPLKPLVSLYHQLPFREGVLEKAFWTNAASLLKI